MGKFLHQLGNYAFNNGWKVIGAWLITIALLGFLATQFMQPTSNSISIPGTEAQKALDRMGELFPDAGKGSGRFVFAAPAGKTIDDYKQQIDEAVKETKAIDGVATAVSPFENPMAMSKDRTIAYAQVQLDGANGAIDESTLDAASQVAQKARTNGLTAEMGGDLTSEVPGEILGVGEIAGVAIALLVLLMTLGSLVAAGMPLAVALVSVGTSMAGLFALGSVIDISATTPVLAVMLGLAVGIDYSLFIISKYRTYLLGGFTKQDAAAKAVATAGNAVIFAAATVVIALSALAIVQVPFMTTMGLAGAATVAIAAVVAVTLIPALLGLAGDRVFGGKTRSTIAAAAKKPAAVGHVDRKTFWYKWGTAITKRPIIVLVAATVLITTIALPVRDLQLGLPTDEHAAASSTERKAYDELAKGFGVGFNGPLLVVVENLPAVTSADRAAVRQQLEQQFTTKVAEAAASQEAILTQRAATLVTAEEFAQFEQDKATAIAQGQAEQAEALVQLERNAEQYAQLLQVKKVADRIATLDGVEQALPALATADGTKGAIQIIPKTAPSDQKTNDLIAYLRSSDYQKQLGDSSDVTLAVTGSTALQNDINTKLSGALPQYLAVVVGLSLVLLVVAFRSILVPIKATLGFLLSVLAMFGALVVVFQWGWFGIAEAPGPIVSFIPIIAIGILFGLAMDYEFFLVSSMHESYTHHKDAKKAVVDGFGLGSKVVTAAGIIMIAVFAGFITNHDVTVQAIGFGLAVGILIDAFVVRMTMVPAAMTLLGSSAWWLPKWLDRIVPHVSIEGEQEKK